MSKRGSGYGSENRVNILKKVKIGKNWNLYPAVVEANGKLRDKVRVRGKIEVHPEGYYYIEWWQDGRKREQIKNRAEVVARAPRKAIEFEANRVGIRNCARNRQRERAHSYRSGRFLSQGHGATAARTQDPTWPTSIAWNCSPATVPSASSRT